MIIHFSLREPHPRYTGGVAKTSKHRCSDVRERQALIDRHAGLIACVARQLAKSGADIDELTAVGAIGLIKAANTFKPTRHRDFTTYSLRCIVREAVLYLHNKGHVTLEQRTYKALMCSICSERSNGCAPVPEQNGPVNDAAVRADAGSKRD